MASGPSTTDRHDTHVWVRLELVAALVAGGGVLPKNWRPRKRVRTQSSHDPHDWGWCRARVNAARSIAAGESHDDGASAAVPPLGSPFKVKLRQVTPTKPPPVAAAAPPPRESPWGGTGRVAMTLTVDDAEHAPSALQGATVDFVYDAAAAPGAPWVCAANAWWLQEPLRPPRDLTQLEQLHEPAVVYCLKRRYEEDRIYTYTGKILLALNPFRSLPAVYAQDTMRQYWQATHGDDAEHRPPPHVFAIADDAYRSMMDSMSERRPARNQSILVSGESGAGKTVTTKVVMRYLATVSSHCSTAALSGIEYQVLESNPILESFGNARTLRNDNSSRFGKFIDIQFTRSGKLVSASIETYLLEKVRLISQAPGERNFHIFYELLAGLPPPQRRDLSLGSLALRDFRMTATSGTFDRRDGVDDQETFRELTQALETVGFTTQEQQDIFVVVAALLHTSNLTFRERDMDASELDFANASVKAAIALWGVKPDDLNDALCRCRIEAQKEVLYKNLTVAQAHKAVEALIKVTYGALFAFIVRRINDSIGRASTGPAASIGVLDIFGFETFDVNGFEQLFINYTNEVLQQQFNRFVFKLEQEEYRKEGIDWSFIEFPDNQDVLDLIEKSHDGILSILDEQCRLARCTDTTFVRAVYDKCACHPRFEATKQQQGKLTFSIHHYAGMVEYETLNFLEKNKDELPKEAIALLKSSVNNFVSQLGQDSGASTTASPGKARGRAHGHGQLHRAGSSLLRDSVGIQFSQQLKSLRIRIETTEPHYIRCLKPNDYLVPHTFNETVIADQLRCAGVLEAIRVSRVGFPHRFYHDHFVQRFGILARSEMTLAMRCHRGIEVCQILVDLLVPQLIKLMGDNEAVGKSAHQQQTVYLGMQMGRTKVFLRRQAFEALDYLRSKKFADSATVIQSIVRGYFARGNFEVCIIAIIVIQTAWRRARASQFVKDVRALRAAVKLQCAWRCFMSRRILWSIRRVALADKAALTIQCAWRCHTARIIAWDFKMAVVGDQAATIIQSAWSCSRARTMLWSARLIAWWCQSTYRGAVARQYCAYLFLNAKAGMIQRSWRHSQAPSSFRRLQKAVLTLQCRQREITARKELYRLRREAKDLSKIVAERDKYREESKKLQKELDHIKKSPSEKRKLMLKTEEIRLLQQEIERLKAELQKTQSSSGRLTTQHQHVDKCRSLMEELSHRESHLVALRQEMDSLRSGVEDKALSSMVESGGVNDSFEFPSPKTHRRIPNSKTTRTDTSLLDNEILKPSYVGRDLTNTDLKFLFQGSGSINNAESVSSYDDLEKLHSAIRQGDRRSFDAVLQSNGEACLLVNQGDQYGRTGLHLAALALRSGMIEVLLSKGAVVNAQDDDGETPLHLAESYLITELLLVKGRANPNIPNIDGICAIHLAVQRRDIDSVRILVQRGASVNSADNIRWFTPLHLVALPAKNKWDEKPKEDLRLRIAQILTEDLGPDKADLDYQDSDGNAPLHYAAQLESPEASALVRHFLDKGADPNIPNDREQTPLHLLCHNEGLRQLGICFQDTLQEMLYRGADPNHQSMTGCTPLHLALYHKDIDTAVQLVRCGADINMSWKKPARWTSFWYDQGSSNVLSIDMVEKDHDLHRILSVLPKAPRGAPARDWCMHCKRNIGSNVRAAHCGHCSRLVCHSCTSSCLPPEFFPKSFEKRAPSHVCVICEHILTTRKDDHSFGTVLTQPVSSFSDGASLSIHDQASSERYAC